MVEHLAQIQALRESANKKCDDWLDGILGVLVALLETLQLLLDQLHNSAKNIVEATFNDSDGDKDTACTFDLRKS